MYSSRAETEHGGSTVRKVSLSLRQANEPNTPGMENMRKKKKKRFASKSKISMLSKSTNADSHSSNT